VRDVLRGIRAEHSQPVKRAESLQLRALEASITGYRKKARSTVASERLRYFSDQALILLGFRWAFRSDGLCQLHVEHITARSGASLEIFLASGKTDREHLGRTVMVPAVKCYAR